MKGSFFRELAIIAQKCGPEYTIHASSFRDGGKWGKSAVNKRLFFPLLPPSSDAECLHYTAEAGKHSMRVGGGVLTPLPPLTSPEPAGVKDARGKRKEPLLLFLFAWR